MIPLLPEKRPDNIENKPQKSWQKLLREAVTDVDKLWDLLELPESERSAGHRAHALFPLKVPMSFIARMQKGTVNDPLLKQILPLGVETSAETLSDPNFSHDPVADLANNPVPGLIHKYHGRVLLITTGACAVHCRYCFRRHFPYNEQTAARNQWQTTLAYIKSDSSIHEVILSGGDPLSLSDAKLGDLFTVLNTISHIKTIRIHTRQPIVLPERIDNGFINLVQKSHKNIVMVLHANHANELDQNVSEACHKLRKNKVHLLNQAVLLKDINDNSDSLINLSHKLFEIGVMPYYLNLLDKVSGASHFEVTEERALELSRAMQASLPGYLVPRLVRDIPDKPHKTWL